MAIETAPAARAGRLTIVRVPDPDGLESFARVVEKGLTARPKTLPCHYFYDETGSQLFEQICELPEYYLTRTEDAILREHARAMLSAWDEAPAMIELGSGSSSKTQRLIATALGMFGDLHYLPIDVSPTVLEESAEALVRTFPGLRVTGYAADYHHALTSLAKRVDGPKCLVFLGSSLGNYETEGAVRLLGHIARIMGPRDRLILGTDLVKDPATLEAAYDDAQGVTAQFNLNLLHRINRELGADFGPDQFEHRAIYRPDDERVEMHLVSRMDQVVRIPAAGLQVNFERGESIHTENSHKYSVERLRDLAERSGFVEEAAWTDPEALFRVQRWKIRTRAR